MNLPDELTHASTTQKLEAFFESYRSSQWISDLARQYPHERWPSQSHTTFSASDLNKYAATIIDALYAGDQIEDALAGILTPIPFWNTWHHELEPALKTAFSDAGFHDLDEDCRSQIEDNWHDAAVRSDATTISNIFARHDQCEVLFIFNRSRDLDDNLIECHKPWSDASELAITTELQFALSNIGYTIGEFRKLAGNRHQAYTPLPRVRPRRPKLVDWPRLNEAIENSCSRIFSFAIYGIVPILDLFELDLAQPLTMSKSWLATVDPISGTFHDVPVDGPVTLAPADGYLLSGGHLAWSPDDICGLYRPHYCTRISNTAVIH